MRSACMCARWRGTTSRAARSSRVISSRVLMDAAATIGVVMTFDIAKHGDFHDRVIVSDNGWRITLGKGLDIFQSTVPGALFSQRMQEFRTTSHFTITYLKEEQQ